jgi:DNA-binding NtrC family response regulator
MPRDTQVGLLGLLRGSAASGRTQSKAAAIRVRLIGTDLSDPAQLLNENGIRQDLLYQLSTIVIALPPLRDRREDIPLLAQMFVEQINADGSKQVSGLAAEAIEVLLAYDWPGNVRELHDVIAQAHADASSKVVSAENLTARIQGAQGGAFAGAVSDPPLDLDATLAETERSLIEQAIKRARGNKSVAAELLSITRPRLYRRMQMLGMDDEGEFA